jgi:hypothetical protein
MTSCARRRTTLREIAAELKELRLYGMAGAWVDLTSQGQTGIESSRWLIEHLLQAEQTDRAMRSISYQLKSAHFPVHRDLRNRPAEHILAAG